MASVIATSNQPSQDSKFYQPDNAMKFRSSAVFQPSTGGVLGSLAALNNGPGATEANESPGRRYHTSINLDSASNACVQSSHRRAVVTSSNQQHVHVRHATLASATMMAPAPPYHAAPIIVTSDDEETYRRQRTTDFKVGRNLFNRNPEQGMAYLILRGFVQPNPNAIASMFSSRLGLNRQRIGEFLSTPSNQSQLAASVLSRLAANIDMATVDIDIALRRFLDPFHLPGEAQRIERILRVFAHHYSMQNQVAFSFLPEDCSFADKCDLAHLLVYAVVMLNTDLHSPAISRRESRMSQTDFICNFQGAGNNAAVMPAEKLAAIYERIRLTPLTPSEDNTTNVSRVEEAILARRQPLVAHQRRLICYCCLVELRGDPLRGQKTEEKPPLSKNSLSQPSNRRCSFPASFTEGLRNRQADVKNGADRQLFLFNDLLVVTKLGRRRQSTAKRLSLNPNNAQPTTPNKSDVFLFRRSLPLLGLSFATFSTSTSPYGIRLTTVEENGKTPSTLYFCARTPEDHQHFVQDLQEAIAEATLTEATRLDIEKCPLPNLDKLFDPSDFEDVSSIISDIKTSSASSLTVSNETATVTNEASPSTSPNNALCDGQSSSATGDEGGLSAATSVSGERLSRRHSRTSLDSGVGEIGSSQTSIAVADTRHVTSRKHNRHINQPSTQQIYGSRSVEKSNTSAGIEAVKPSTRFSNQAASASSSTQCRANSVGALC